MGTTLRCVPVPPEWLDDLAREHWFAVVGPLVTLNVAKAIDTLALALMCDAWSRWRSLRDLCGDDAALKAKYAYALSRLQKDWLDIGCRFAMTASDRTRIEVEGDTPTEAAERFVV